MSCGIAAFSKRPGKAQPSAASKLPAIAAINTLEYTQTGGRLVAPESLQIVHRVDLAKYSGTNAFAQDQSKFDSNVQILRDKLKADKKLLVAFTMQLSDAEALGFWPIFESYQKDLEALDDRLLKTIMNYADAYNNDTLTDQLAMKIFDETMAIFNDEIKIGKNYSTKLVGVLPGKKVVRYLQIEGKLRAQMWCELASEIPLVE